MDTAKVKARAYKLALAIAIIRNKPASMSALEFTKLLQLNFTNSFIDNRTVIQNLEKNILTLTQELSVLKLQEKIINEIPFEALQITATLSETIEHSLLFHKTSDTNQAKLKTYQQVKEEARNYDANLKFLSDIIKLKTLSKDFQMNEDTLTILKTLKDTIEQIRFFFQSYDEEDPKSKAEIMSDKKSDASFVEDDSAFAESTTLFFITQEFEQPDEIYCLFPLDTLLHGLQMVVNIFQIEWLYYFRNDMLVIFHEFIEFLIKFIIECDDLKIHESKIECACNMLINLSMCDYLLDFILDAMIVTLKTVSTYLRESEDKENNEALILNTSFILECLDSIINLRSLSYNTKINAELKKNLNELLNFVFIELSDSYPFLAIRIAKLIELNKK